MPLQLRSVKCIRVDHSTKTAVYVLVATFAGGPEQIENRYIGKTVSDLTAFRKNVLRLSNSSTSPQSAAQLPELKEKRGFMGGWKDDVNRSTVDEFCRHLMKLPSEILEQKDVTNFFTESSSDNENGALNMLKKSEPTKRQAKEKGKGDAPSLDATSSSPYSQVMPAPKIDSVSSNPSNNSDSIYPYEEIGNLPNSSMSPDPPLTSIYSLVKSDPGDRHFVGADGYAVATASTSPVIKITKTEVKRAVSDQPQLYSSVNKPKLEPQASINSPCDVLYADTICFPAQKLNPDLVLYEDATSINSMNPVPLKPNLPNDSWRSDVRISAAKTPVLAPAPAPAPAPLTSIPPMPPFPAPMLQPPDLLLDDSPKSDDTVREIQVVAISDYDATAENVLSFRKGAVASLLLQSDSSWWCIRLGSAHGWVPAAYWRMLNSGECANLITKGNSAWFVGKLSRSECETLLMDHGQQRHFVVRESNNGHYALSVKYNDKIHHFPIEVTADKKYNIGRHDFKTVNNVILYYQKNALFHDDRGQGVTLGSPLVIIKH